MRDVASLAKAARRHGDAIGVYAERLLDTDLPWTKCGRSTGCSGSCAGTAQARWMPRAPARWIRRRQRHQDRLDAGEGDREHAPAAAPRGVPGEEERRREDARICCLLALDTSTELRRLFPHRNWAPSCARSPVTTSAPPVMSGALATGCVPTCWLSSLPRSTSPMATWVRRCSSSCWNAGRRPPSWPPRPARNWTHSPAWPATAGPAGSPSGSSPRWLRPSWWCGPSWPAQGRDYPPGCSPAPAAAHPAQSAGTADGRAAARRSPLWPGQDPKGP